MMPVWCWYDSVNKAGVNYYIALKGRVGSSFIDDAHAGKLRGETPSENGQRPYERANRPEAVFWLVTLYDSSKRVSHSCNLQLMWIDWTGRLIGRCLDTHAAGYGAVPGAVPRRASTNQATGLVCPPPPGMVQPTLDTHAAGYGAVRRCSRVWCTRWHRRR